MKIDIFSKESQLFLISNHNNGLIDELTNILDTNNVAKVKNYKSTQLLDPLLCYFSKNVNCLSFDEILIQISKKKAFSKLVKCFVDQDSFLAINKVIEIVNRINDIKKLDHYISLINITLKFLKEEETLFSLVKNFCHSITILNSQNSLPYSGSSNACIGHVWVSYVQKPPLIAEMLIHEAAHAKLFCFQEFQEVHNLSDSEFWEDNKYYSPWRIESRPLGGLFHGLFVFFHVLKWYHFLICSSLFKEFRNSIILPRILLVGLQLKSAIYEIQKINKNVFTDDGLNIIEKTHREIKFILSKYEHISSNSVQYFPIDRVTKEDMKLSDFINGKQYDTN